MKSLLWHIPRLQRRQRRRSFFLAFSSTSASGQATGNRSATSSTTRDASNTISGGPNTNNDGREDRGVRIDDNDHNTNNTKDHNEIITPHHHHHHRHHDFAHHRPGVARLNHASFGAVPRPVLDVQDAFRQEWLAQPDALYFSGDLHDRMRQAATTGATTLTSKTTNPTSTTATYDSSSTTPAPVVPSPSSLPSEHVCLFENATVATCAVAYHWTTSVTVDMQPGDVVIYLTVAYKACVNILQEYCVRQRGARLVPLSVPFPATTADDILTSLRHQLEVLVTNQGGRPKFAFLDHVSSQPSILFPIKEMIALVREFGVQEVCVDGAHAVGSVPSFDVRDLDCDYYYSNLHKWAFAPSTATVFWSSHTPVMRHPITSWAWGHGLAEETLFPGTRDFSAMAAVPAAVEYLQQQQYTWQSPDDKQHASTSAEYCHGQVVKAASFLRDAWGVEEDHATDASLVATQAMVRLPSQLQVTDRPGQVSRGVRDVLRDEYHIEAAVGNFGDAGNFLRLSWAVYNTWSDIERLAQAILEIEASHRRSSGV